MLIEASATGDGQVASAVWLGGSLLCQRQAPLPARGGRGVGRAASCPRWRRRSGWRRRGGALAGVLLDEAAQGLLAGLLDRLPPGDTVEVVLSAAGAALALPVELIRLATGAGRGGGAAGAAGRGQRVPPAPPRPPAAAGTPGPGEAPPAPAGLPGPLKVLAAVAAPDETKTDERAAGCRGGDAGGAGRRHRRGRQPDGAGADLGGGLAGADPPGPGAGRVPRAAPVRARVADGGGAGGRGRQPGPGDGRRL